MPQVIFRYNESISRFILPDLGNRIRKLMAKTLSTKEHPLTPKDIDWLPYKNTEESMAPYVGIEIRMIGYPDRRKKLTLRILENLKMKSLETLNSLNGNKFKASDPLIWVQFTDGPHV